MSVHRRFGGEHRLKSYSMIKKVFSQGKESISFPIKVKYIHESNCGFQFAVAVSKKKFKRAVDRNFIKRQMRAALHQVVYDQLAQLDAVLIFMFIGSEPIPFDSLVEKIKKVVDEVDKKK